MNFTTLPHRVTSRVWRIQFLYALTASGGSWRHVLVWFGRRGAPAVAAPSQCLSAIDADELDLEEADWDDCRVSTKSEPQALESLFWGFLLCVAVVALPLLGCRLTFPDVALQGAALEEALMWSLPVLLLLPFLFAGCLVALARNPASRRAETLAAFFGGLVIGLATLRAMGV